MGRGIGVVIRCVGWRMQEDLEVLKEVSWLLEQAVPGVALVAQHLLCLSADSLGSCCCSIKLKLLGILVP